MLGIQLTHWGRVTHICVGKLIIIGSDNGLSPDRRQAIIWTNAGLLSIGPLRTYFSENLIKIQQFSLKKMQVKVSSAKCRPSCLGLNVLTYMYISNMGPRTLTFWISRNVYVSFIDMCITSRHRTEPMLTYLYHTCQLDLLLVYHRFCLHSFVDIAIYNCTLSKCALVSTTYYTSCLLLLYISCMVYNMTPFALSQSPLATELVHCYTFTI